MARYASAIQKRMVFTFLVLLPVVCAAPKKFVNDLSAWPPRLPHLASPIDSIDQHYDLEGGEADDLVALEGPTKWLPWKVRQSGRIEKAEELVALVLRRCNAGWCCPRFLQCCYTNIMCCDSQGYKIKSAKIC